MSDQRVEVLRIERGSLLVLHDVELHDGAEEQLVRGLIDVVGHQQFLVLYLHEGSRAEVIGPGGVEQFLASLNIEPATPEQGDTPDGTIERHEA